MHYKKLARLERSSRSSIRFLLGFEEVTLVPSASDQTLLSWLRDTRRLTGTKEGCGEGDCGACTVVIAEWRDDRVVYNQVNACIVFLASLDGKQLFTVEHLTSPDEGKQLHPMQQAMVTTHATQCGFCTPGIVMSLAALHWQGVKHTEDGICEALAGNLCRCTGYGPIIEAAKLGFGQSLSPSWYAKLAESELWLKNTAHTLTSPTLLETAAGTVFIPRRLTQLHKFIAANPEARIVSGATDVGLWVTKQGKRLPKMVLVNEVEELQHIAINRQTLRLGGAVTYQRALPLIEGDYPSLGALMRRIGSAQVRNRGTIGGNIANGSPIGDMPPILMALGATITLSHSGGSRRLPLEQLYFRYGEQHREPFEVVSEITIPRPNADFTHGKAFVRAYKISKRFDQDISTVMACFYIRLTRTDDLSEIEDVRLCYGGMAGVPAHARLTERFLRGRFFGPGTFRQAMEGISKDFNPLSDMRASAEYRLEVAANLLWRFYLDITDASKTGVMLLENRDPFRGSEGQGTGAATHG